MTVLVVLLLLVAFCAGVRAAAVLCGFALGLFLLVCLTLASGYAPGVPADQSPVLASVPVP